MSNLGSALGTSMQQSQYGQNGMMGAFGSGSFGSSSFQLPTSGNKYPNSVLSSGEGSTNNDNNGQIPSTNNNFDPFGSLGSSSGTSNSVSGNKNQSQTGNKSNNNSINNDNDNNNDNTKNNNKVGDYQNGFDFSSFLLPNSDLIHGQMNVFQTNSQNNIPSGTGSGANSGTKGRDNVSATTTNDPLKQVTKSGHKADSDSAFGPQPVLQGDYHPSNEVGFHGLNKYDGITIQAPTRAQSLSGLKAESGSDSVSNLNGCEPFPKNCPMECLNIGAGGCIQCSCAGEFVDRLVQKWLGINSLK